MPGFIGVRAGDLVPADPATDVPDIYIPPDAGAMSVGLVDNTLDTRTAPTGTGPYSLTWSFGTVKDVRAALDAGGGTTWSIWTSADGGKTWTAGPVSTVEPRLARQPDELYGISPVTAIKKSVDGGTTWTTLATAPTGRVFNGNIGASEGYIYVETGAV